MNYLIQQNSRNDNSPGYIYLMEAVGFHGILGRWARYKRIKIGLSRNPHHREHNLNGQQAPCDINLIADTYVSDMAAAEDYLHKMFSSCHVELRRSKEWYDFNYFQYVSLRNEFKKISRDPSWNPMARKRLSTMQRYLIVLLAGFSLLGLTGIVAYASHLGTAGGKVEIKDN